MDEAYADGYLQFKASEGGPYKTGLVKVRNEYGSHWLAHFQGRWRKVYIQVNRTYILYLGEKITIQIDGV